MRRYVLTGAPGAGKTSIAEELRRRGYPVVTEAATDVIAVRQGRGSDEPWREPGFVEAVVRLQRHRQQAADARGHVQVYDRSPLCTLALARYLGRPVSPTLAAEVNRVALKGIYQRQVFLVEPLGFVTPTAARRISLAESLEFARVHTQVYVEHGHELVAIAPGSVTQRATAVATYLGPPAPIEETPDPVYLT
ncbi:AAA family ATPase [Micromonospora sp. NPDC094482]|uniref:AAA family ATPase n=1 Tax=unclassified Micromonospora TaxID=2617518 RepID=UPI00331FC64F